jgi:hypothetical protein
VHPSDLLAPAEPRSPRTSVDRDAASIASRCTSSPACPDLEDQAKVAELLEIERIGVTLTEEFHLVPEQSTSAIIVPHPEAKSFIA